MLFSLVPSTFIYLVQNSGAGKNVCGAVELMSSMIPRSWKLTRSLLTEDLVWLMRQIKKGLVCGEGNNSIRRANTRREWQSACESLHGPQDARNLGRCLPARGPAGSVAQTLSRAACLPSEKSESYAFKEGPVISSIFEFFVCHYVQKKGKL